MLKIEEDYTKKQYGTATEDNELSLYKVSTQFFNLVQNQKWTIWEFVDYDAAKKKWAEQNYEKLCRKVAWFDNIISFHQVWNRLPHANVSSILCDGEKFKVFRDFEDIPY